MKRAVYIIPLAFLFFFCSDKNAETVPKVKLTRLFDFSFEMPVFLSSANYFGQKAFVVAEKSGNVVYAYRTSLKKPWSKTVFLDFRKKVCTSGNEEGLLGFTFDPEFEKNNRIYVYYSRCSPRKSTISRIILQTSMKDWDPRSGPAPYHEEIILEFDQPYSNHNGGHLAFGPDGYLYIGSGDGGAAGDPHNNAQNKDSRLGKILRLHVAGPSGYTIPAGNPFLNSKAPEVYAYGLRNPWRFSFDLKSKKLYAGDVGQNKYEEISVIEKGGNYGWRWKEGFHCYNPSQNCDRPDLIDPIYEYSHKQGASVTGGYVYRGETIPALYGYYIFGDFVTGKIWNIALNGEAPDNARLLLDTGLNISSFAQDDDGELYILDYGSGYVYALENISN